MRLATVAGKVTLSVRHPSVCCGRFLLVSPWNADTCRGHEKWDPSIVVFDELGADLGQNIGVSEGREAAMPFENPTPLDAYASILADEIYYQPAPSDPPSPPQRIDG